MLCIMCQSAGLLHRLLAEYIQTSRGSEVAEAVEQLAGPAMLRMIHTQHGAYVGCAIFAYGTPKDRKKAIKSMKGELWPDPGDTCSARRCSLCATHAACRLCPII